MALDRLTTPVADGEGFRFEVPDGWQQGRGAFGGLVVAALVRALETRAGDRPLRSLQADLCGPALPGPSHIAVEVLRAGSGLTTIAARLVQDGVCAHATAEFGRARGEGWREVSAPAVPPWTEVPPIPMDFAPRFARNFEFRPLRLPFDEQGAGALGWIRPKEPGAKRDAAYIAANIDAWWPAAFGRMAAPKPMATTAYMLQIVEGLAGLDPDAPFLHVGHSRAAAGGYAVESRELWGIDGRLVAVNQQTMAILG